MLPDEDALTWKASNIILPAPTSSNGSDDLRTPHPNEPTPLPSRRRPGRITHRSCVASSSSWAVWQTPRMSPRRPTSAPTGRGRASMVATCEPGSTRSPCGWPSTTSEDAGAGSGCWDAASPRHGTTASTRTYWPHFATWMRGRGRRCCFMRSMAIRSERSPSCWLSPRARSRVGSRGGVPRCEPAWNQEPDGISTQPAAPSEFGCAGAS